MTFEGIRKLTYGPKLGRSSDVPSESDVAPTTFAYKVDTSLRRHLDIIHKTSAVVHIQPAEDILKLCDVLFIIK